MINLPTGSAICYSGYREGQCPRANIFPSYDEIKQDLQILAESWDLLRIYDCSQHAFTVLDVIKQEQMDFKVMLGVDLLAEVSNPNCPWGATYVPQTLEMNRRRNSEDMDTMILLANAHPDIVFAVSIGNEASVDWTDHLVPQDHLIEYAKRVKAAVKQPVTFCENYVPWLDQLAPLAENLDFLSVHTYPVWEFKSIENALDYTIENLKAVQASNPNKKIIITEAGWTTRSNGRGIQPENASEDLQAEYVKQLVEWARKERMLCFVFEAFDEPWKGSPDPDEPEKHWGIYKVDRSPKPVIGKLSNLM